VAERRLLSETDVHEVLRIQGRMQALNDIATVWAAYEEAIKEGNGEDRPV
jgi:collagenase-like PrtC family protease